MRSSLRSLLQWILGIVESRLRKSSLWLFGTTSIQSLDNVELLSEVQYSTREFGMLCLEQETYKFPVGIRKTSCSDGIHLQPRFQYSTIPDGVIAGNGRVFDSRSRLVEESVASHHEKAGNPGFLRTRKAQDRPGVALNLNWWSGTGNIYHWNRDVLARAYVLKALDSSKEINLVVPSRRLPYQDHGISRLLRMYPKLKLVEQQFGDWVRYEEVIVPGCNSVDVGSGFLHPEVADFVREINLLGVPENPRSIPLLYVSRCKSRHRRVLDEEKLINELSAIAPVQVVNLEDYSYLEQMQLMNSVEILVGPYGAGLTHLLFTQQNALVEIHNGDSRETHFATLALACGARYTQIQGLKSDERQDFRLGPQGIRVLRDVTAEFLGN